MLKSIIKITALLLATNTSYASGLRTLTCEQLVNPDPNCTYSILLATVDDKTYHRAMMIAHCLKPYERNRAMALQQLSQDDSSIVFSYARYNILKVNKTDMTAEMTNQGQTLFECKE